ncbi:Integrase [Salinihabitans flavidus]|uniref:Integrase n=1 Tax=Salinihabitans flavidus TaxID=569882 RepID=A0A1H8SB90_9RHOB|nr:Integrase [Salinihabitans flavidus]
MPKRVKELSALEVKRLEYPHEEMKAKGNKPLPVFKAVGGVAGLHLQLTPGEGKSWTYRYSVRVPGTDKYKRRSLGLGSYPEVGVGEARDRAREAKDKIRQGIDPIKERKAARVALAAEVAKLTFAQAIDGWDREHLHKFSSEKHRLIWLSSVRAVEGLQDMQVDQVEQEDVWRCLEPIAKRTPDTARRVRGRIAAVLDWAEDEKQRSGPNPASTGWIKRKLSAKTAGAKVTHQPALQVEDAARWMADLRQREGLGSRALEFLALTAVRSGEVRGATWDEIDLDKGVWTIPAERMKMKRDHTVPLPVDAMALLKALPRMESLVFPAARGGQMSDMTLSATMKRMHESDLKAGGLGFLDKDSERPAVPHGLRSCFRVWAGQQGFSREHAELALAHQFGDSVEQAYQRDIYTEQRRPMMEAWAALLGDKGTGENVVPMQKAGA